MPTEGALLWSQTHETEVSGGRSTGVVGMENVWKRKVVSAGVVAAGEGHVGLEHDGNGCA